MPSSSAYAPTGFLPATAERRSPVAPIDRALISLAAFLTTTTGLSSTAGAKLDVPADGFLNTSQHVRGDGGAGSRKASERRAETLHDADYTRLAETQLRICCLPS